MNFGVAEFINKYIGLIYWIRLLRKSCRLQKNIPVRNAPYEKFKERSHSSLHHRRSQSSKPNIST
ncbi:MAG: hypothetical protein AAF208_01575 [Cyanobacteria bacterium P01_A01_bin.45]